MIWKCSGREQCSKQEVRYTLTARTGSSHEGAAPDFLDRKTLANFQVPKPPLAAKLFYRFLSLYKLSA
jgi:hypothetical protein